MSTSSALDLCVEQLATQLEALAIAQPDLLVWQAGGAGLLPERLARAKAVPLDSLAGLPELFAGETLYVGELGGLNCWLAPDPCLELGARHAPAWQSGLFAWLAARQGALRFVHTTAGAGLASGADSVLLGELALVRDHLNMSGSTPLLGLSDSSLGPLFPDLSRLHDAALRRAALDAGRALGLGVREAVLACTQGPSLDTPAERRFLALAGAQAAAQGAAVPLLSAAHAGLRGLSIVAVTEVGSAPVSLREMLAHSERLAPALEELLLALVPHLAHVCAAERGPGA